MGCEMPLCVALLSMRARPGEAWRCCSICAPCATRTARQGSSAARQPRYMPWMSSHAGRKESRCCSMPALQSSSIIGPFGILERSSVQAFGGWPPSSSGRHRRPAKAGFLFWLQGDASGPTGQNATGLIIERNAPRRTRLGAGKRGSHTESRNPTATPGPSRTARRWPCAALRALANGSRCALTA